MGLHDSVIPIYRKIADYHYAPVDGKVKGKHFATNHALTAITFLLNKTQLALGDPGWGKTTGAQVISSLFSGLPFDLYQRLMMKGHPGQYEEKLVARPHFGALSKGDERVVWQGSIGLDALIVDEIKHLPKETQALLLEGIRTGTWTYLNDSITEGEKPTYFTSNDWGEANGEIMEALADRMAVVIEEKALSPHLDYFAAEENIRKDLYNPKVTQACIDELAKDNYKGFKQSLDKIRSKVLTSDIRGRIQKEISDLPAASNDAYYFLWGLAAEINFSERYGVKRARDPISDQSHDLKYAGVKVLRSMSPRPLMAAWQYAQGLAWLLGHDKVDVDHLQFVLPHVLAHRIKFANDFKNAHANSNREDFMELHLAKLLVKEYFSGTYTSSILNLKSTIKKLQDGVNVSVQHADHPLVRQLAQWKQKMPQSDI